MTARLRVRARSRPVMLALCAVGGVGLGLAAFAMSYSGVKWLVDAASFPAIYIAIVVLIARFAGSWRSAAVRVGVFFVAFVLSYYAAMADAFESVPLFYAVAWLAAALTVCPAVAAAVWRSHALGGWRAIVVAALVAASASVNRVLAEAIRFASGNDVHGYVQPVQLVIDLGCGVAAILLITSGRWQRLLASGLWLTLSIVLSAAVVFVLSPSGSLT